MYNSHIATMETKTINTETQWTDERIIDMVRKLRNDLIKDFLDDRFLREYMASHFRMPELSKVKIEFIRRDLKEMLISPVDTKHYELLINQIKHTDSAALTEVNEKLFYKELENTFKRYIYE